MINCPKCCRHIDERTTVCECGAILFGEVTNIAPWETETVFRTATVVAKRNIAPVIGVVALVALGTLLLALPKLSVSVDSNEAVPESSVTLQSQDQTRSDLIPSDDLIEQASMSPFAFMPNEAKIQSRVMRKSLRAANVAAPTAALAAAAKTSLDVQLPLESNLTSAKKTTDPANCEPDVTSSLKKPEPAIAEAKKAAETPSSPYLLGPRGGCFIVTASGGKKYVDRALCAPVSSARQ